METKCYCGHTTTCDCGPEEPKQETFEEAAVINYKKLYEGEPLTQDVPIDAFKQGVKWQQERSYSEDEVDNITQQLRLKLKSGVLKWQEDFEFDLEEWFEQFKKK